MPSGYTVLRQEKNTGVLRASLYIKDMPSPFRFEGSFSFVLIFTPLFTFGTTISRLPNCIPTHPPASACIIYYPSLT